MTEMSALLLGGIAYSASIGDPDWIIVGGGAGGCAAAATLVDAGESVIVIERGGDDRKAKETQDGGHWPTVVTTSANELIRFSEG